MRTYIPDKHSLKGGILIEVISLHIGTISRREGRLSVQMAAYCSRSKMLDERTGKTYNYTKRSDLVHHEVMLPDHAPNTVLNSEVLWNSVEEVERSRNARLARVIIAALPKELDTKTHVAMVQQYAQEHFVQRGMCVDVSVHDKGDGNPHAQSAHVRTAHSLFAVQLKYCLEQAVGKEYQAMQIAAYHPPAYLDRET